MAKNLKLNIKNTQIAQAINLGGIKKAIAKKSTEKAAETAASPEDESSASKTAKVPPKSAPLTKSPQAKNAALEEEVQDLQPKAKARSRSAFADPSALSASHQPIPEEVPAQEAEIESLESPVEEVPVSVEPVETPVETAQEEPQAPQALEQVKEQEIVEKHVEKPVSQEVQKEIEPKAPLTTQATHSPPSKIAPKVESAPRQAPVPRKLEGLRPSLPRRNEPSISSNLLAKKEHGFLKDLPVREKFGPTGRHINDLLPKKAPTPPPAPKAQTPSNQPKPRPAIAPAPAAADDANKKPAKFKDFKDVKPTPKKPSDNRSFDSRDSRGLRGGSSEDERWRKRRVSKNHRHEEDTTIRPSSLKVRVPIAIKDLASEMKLKASQLIQKLFLQGIIVTLNDMLEDEVTLQLLGHEFGCEIAIDRTEANRIQITGKSISEEVAESNPDDLIIRPSLVAFMGHVDHGKTSLIDSIRKSNRASGEAGAITQHIGAFMCSTPVGDIAILDTPGHEAFSAMRERGANVTDIVVLVVAGDEGIRQQTIEAINHAKAAEVTIVVAINKSDKPNFNPDNVYRQLSEQELLPEKWGGQTITVNCSAVTGEGIPELLEMLALQAEVLELKANPKSRARGTVIESEMHKGLGSKATVLVQNGTLKKGDALVFEHHWGRVKTMHNDLGKEVQQAGPSHPVEITGLSGLPEAGQEFIVVKSEKEAKEISAKRMEGFKQNSVMLKKKLSMESLFENAKDGGKKVLNLVIRADVQGSLEALKNALEKIKSTKAELNIIYAGVGEVSESDVILAAASKGVVLGFHTQIESHAETLVKEQGVVVKLHNIIYHAIDDIKDLMKNLLDKIPQETEKGKAIVKATFKASQLGTICGCQVTEGVIHRNNLIRVLRGKDVVHKGTISSLKKIKEDVREVTKGIECGILINNFNDALPDDIIEAYEITYLTQEL